jgi:ABC-2 type transport system permease protein
VTLTAPQQALPAGTGAAPPAGGLLRSELRRFRRRRVIQVLAAFYFAVLVTVGGVQFFTHNTDLAGARAQAEAQLAQERQFVEEQRRNGTPADQLPPPESLTVESFLDDPRYLAVNELPTALNGMAMFWALIATMVGATFVGAEWAQKTMVALLFWEPRRLRVVGAKLLALSLGVAAVGVAAQALTLGLGLLTTRLRGSFEGTDQVAGGFWGPLLASSGRGVLLAVLTAAIGFAVVNLVRHTAAVLGLAFAYFAILEPLVVGLRPKWSPYLLGPNVVGFVNRGGFDVPLPTQDGWAGMQEPTLNISNVEGGLYLLAVTLALVVVSAYLFKRRDLT